MSVIGQMGKALRPSDGDFDMQLWKKIVAAYIAAAGAAGPMNLSGFF